jgi:hypothetical protein
MPSSSKPADVVISSLNLIHHQYFSVGEARLQDAKILGRKPSQDSRRAYTQNRPWRSFAFRRAAAVAVLMASLAGHIGSHSGGAI